MQTPPYNQQINLAFWFDIVIIGFCFAGYNEPWLLQSHFARAIQFVITEFECTVTSVYIGHPRDPQKVAVVYRWLLCRGFSIKIGIKTSLARLSLAVVDRWPLFRGSR